MRTTLAGRELLDDPAADPAAVRRSLHHIARANRWFGGAAALRWALGQATAGVPRGAALTLADVGTGAGDLAGAARHWGARRGFAIAPLGFDLSRAAAALARDAGVPATVADGIALPLAGRSVDLVLLSQVAHHFPADAAVALFREADRVARRAVMVLDLRRAGLARVAFRAGAALLRFDRVTTHDGLVSIRRGYTPGELRALAGRAGVCATVARRPGWRVCAVWLRDTA